MIPVTDFQSKFIMGCWLRYCHLQWFGCNWVSDATLVYFHCSSIVIIANVNSKRDNFQCDFSSSYDIATYSVIINVLNNSCVGNSVTPSHYLYTQLAVHTGWCFVGLELGLWLGLGTIANHHPTQVLEPSTYWSLHSSLKKKKNK